MNTPTSNRLLPRSTLMLPTLLSLVTITALLGGCAASGPATTEATPGTIKTDNDQGKVHSASAEDAAFLKSDEPIANNTIILFANGLGCPQCASNIDLQIKKRVPGAESVYVDLAEGTATVDIIPGTKRRLSPKQFEDIVGDAGFTLVKLTSR